ncbi:MAG: hypothetical protein ABIJ92_00105 [Candidatus Aenigmatarchaeota archaeon]
MNETPHGVVLGMYGANALGVTRALGREDIPVAGFHVGGRYPHARHSKYLTEFHNPSGVAELLDELGEFGHKHRTQTGKKAVVYTTGDAYVLLAQDMREDMGDLFHLPVSNKYDLRDLTHKQRIAEIAEPFGFHVPHTILLSELNSSRLDEFEGRVICKPPYSNGFSKEDFYIFEDARTALTSRDEMLEKHEEYVISDFIEGGTDKRVEVHTCLTGRPIIALMLKGDRVYDSQDVIIPITDISTWIPSLVDPSSAFTRGVGFHGPMDINVKIGPDGRAYYLETNFRSSANIALDIEAGLNMPALLYRYFNDMRNEDLISRQIRKGLVWMDESKAPDGEWEKNPADVYAFQADDDPEPFEKSRAEGKLSFQFQRDINK